MSWVPLRDHLRDHLAAQLDEMILHDPDPEARAFLAGNRERVLERLTDQAELVTMRRFLAQREQAAEHKPTIGIIKLNGRKHRAVQ